MRHDDRNRVFYIDHNRQTTQWEPPVVARPAAAGAAAGAAADDAPLPPGWECRTTADGKRYYVDHINRTTSWNDPRLPNNRPEATGLSPEYARNFVLKSTEFRRAHPIQQGEFAIQVRRDHIFEDAWPLILKASPAELRRRFRVSFPGEAGLDYGGLSREFFFDVSKEMFNPYYGLFEYASVDNYLLQLSKNPFLDVEAPKVMRAIGRLVAIAVLNSKFVDAFFVRHFYKMMLGKAPDLSDIEIVDPSFATSLRWMLTNDIDGVIFEHFTDRVNEFGVERDVELKPNGANIEVTNENKAEYVALVTEFRLVGCIRDKVRMFLDGFQDVIPLSALRIFDEKELELLIGGINEIDVDDWEANTIYRAPYSSGHKVIRWFWKTVRSFNPEQRSRLLQFATGTSKVPLGGFKELYGSNGQQQFCIDVLSDANSFPRSHTCFNRIDLPEYKTEAILKAKLTTAIEESSGFGIQ